MEVYFDDFKVTHTKSPVVATDEYYSGGAMFNSYTRENSVINKRKYQSKEWQPELGLELFDFGPRLYDPWRLQTTTHDPHAEKYYAWSPYSWSFDNPTRFVDPTGMDPEDPISLGKLISKGTDAFNSIVDFFFGGGNDGSEESAANVAEANSTLEVVSVEAQNMKAELQETVDQVPGLNAAFSVMDAQQAKTTGGTFKSLGRAAAQAATIPAVGGTPKTGGTITGHTRHGLNQSISRDGGRGVSAAAKLDAVRSPTKTVTQSGGRTQYVGSKAKVTLNSAGKVITATGKNRGSEVSKQGKGNAALRKAKSMGLEYDPKNIR